MHSKRPTTIYYIMAFALAFQGIFLTMLLVPEDTQVDAEYINGVLTASSILFGFWAVLMNRELGVDMRRDIRGPLLWCLGSLVFSVIFVYLTALNLISSVTALSVCTESFISNSFMVSIHLYRRLRE